MLLQSQNAHGCGQRVTLRREMFPQPSLGERATSRPLRCHLPKARRSSEEARVVCSGQLVQVPVLVREMYSWLQRNVDAPAKNGLDERLLELVRWKQHDVVVTLLRCAPSCDRAAVTMWRALVSERSCAERVLWELLGVLEDWPLHSTSTSDGDETEVVVLAATRALREILCERQVPKVLNQHFPPLFLALLFQVYCTIKEEAEEVDACWRKYVEQVSLPTSPSRFMVQTVKALLCCLGYEDVVFRVEHKHGWDTLLHAKSHPYAMGLLAREMCMVKDYFCHCVALQLLDVLNLDEPCLQVPAMAFFVKLLACPDVVELHERALKLFPMFVLSPRIEMRRLVLQGLFTLSQRPEMAERMGFLLPKLLEVLDDADTEVVEMTLSVLGKMLEQRDVAIAGPVVVQLSEKLQPLFDNESASIKVLSFKLFRDVMELLVAVDRKATKRQVRRNLLPLLFHVYDENQPVAEVRILALLGFPWEVAGLPPAPVPHEAQGSRFLLASAPEQQLWEPSLLPPGSTGCPRWRLPQCSARAAKPPADAFPSCCPFPAGPKKDPQPCPGEGMRVLCPGQRCHLPVSAALQASRETLLQATELLKLRKLRKKLKSGQIYKLGKCLLAEDRSRREDYLYQALPYLQSPQESLREAAVVFFGHLGRSVRGQPEEQQTIYQGLECMTNDISQSVSDLAADTLFVLRSEESNRTFRYRLQVLRGWLERMWRR
ncbi:maestro heat-like repeat-containing protein family member 2B [Cuculus canorus]|uniref:maestro heat-like repeat-containing protein family member 2B n=2 Tax=Cuculus canorus TaxID=55661 RepID=UPI0023AA37E5|nr:maestro heat-like repeat-containing protein family member 2B [Cuculus canorus]